MQRMLGLSAAAMLPPAMANAVKKAPAIKTGQAAAATAACAEGEGRVLEWDSRRFTLAEDGMAILPDALSAIQLADLNRQVDSLLAKIEANAAELGAEQLAANELHNGALGAKSNAGFCFGDITQRDPGKYEVRLPEPLPLGPLGAD